MNEPLTITRTEGRVLILHLKGRLDTQTKDKLLNTATLEQAAGTRFLLIDLQGVEMITSAGLAALHILYKLFTPQADVDAWEKGKHGDVYKSAYFKLANAASNIYYILNITGFLHNIPIYPNLDEALKSFVQ